MKLKAEQCMVRVGGPESDKEGHSLEILSYEISEPGDWPTIQAFAKEQGLQVEKVGGAAVFMVPSDWSVTTSAEAEEAMDKVLQPLIDQGVFRR